MIFSPKEEVQNSTSLKQIHAILLQMKPKKIVLFSTQVFFLALVNTNFFVTNKGHS